VPGFIRLVTRLVHRSETPLPVYLTELRLRTQFRAPDLIRLVPTAWTRPVRRRPERSHPVHLTESKPLNPVSGAIIDLIAGTRVVPGAAEVSAATTVPGASIVYDATTVPGASIVSAATPGPADSPRAAGLRLPAPPRILADKEETNC
jgi:hypothetical protein